MEDTNNPTDPTEVESDAQKINLCSFVDITALDPGLDVDSISSIALEHGFRGIVVAPCDILKYRRSLRITNKNFAEKPKIIAAIDYHDGQESLDVREFSILSACQSRAHEIEICAPSLYMANRDISGIAEDVKMVAEVALAHGVTVKYALGHSFDRFNRKSFPELAEKLAIDGITYIQNYIHGYNDRLLMDSIITLMGMKKSTRLKTKIYTSTRSVEDMAKAAKSNANLVGLPWDRAANLTADYADFIRKSQK